MIINCEGACEVKDSAETGTLMDASQSSLNASPHSIAADFIPTGCTQAIDQDHSGHLARAINQLRVPAMKCMAVQGQLKQYYTIYILRSCIFITGGRLSIGPVQLLFLSV